jgi:hypothetical protein
MNKLKQNLTLDDFTIISTPDYISWEELERVLGKRCYKQFSKWMRGQTCLECGVYPHDLDRWLKGLPVID